MQELRKLNSDKTFVPSKTFTPYFESPIFTTNIHEHKPFDWQSPHRIPKPNDWPPAPINEPVVTLTEDQTK